MARIIANLSEKSINGLITAFEKSIRDFETVKNQIIEELADYYIARAQYHLDVSLLHPAESTGRLKSSLDVDYDYAKGIATVFTDVYYARAVEFGAGRKGAGTPYYSFGDEAKRWEKKIEYNKTITGQAPHWFMLRALLDLEENYVSIIDGLLKERRMMKIDGCRYLE